MPLNRPALSLGPGPRGVQDARRWVVATCRDIGREDLVECAELGVSELVTNALLHGEQPIQVRVRGTAQHPRVEVRDGSTERPVLPTPVAEDEDDLLLTFGRGLSIVARSADAWGAEIEEDGKTVWFAPAAAFSEDDGPEGVVTGAVEEPAPVPTDDRDLVEIPVVGVPLRAYAAFHRHYRELRREVRLLALAHEADYPLAKDLSDLFGSLERQLRDGIGSEQIEHAQAAGREVADLRIVMPRRGAQTIDRFLDLLDLADEFCRQQRLLSLARTPEQRDFQRWFLGELVHQAHGSAPCPWRGGDGIGSAVPEGTAPHAQAAHSAAHSAAQLEIAAEPGRQSSVS
ncbi:ATP-binding protein [Nocardioides abyssi]|uniref:ATP-binding protein n=1 Tax=Nocardioides abyssi TaxID=3058370 RepID=A0ABT8EZ61_9ACTN|nr:ATP-binding protein [Nocardioides abyssi]MDN4163369.1 ATP-binding protein [Nocardioides abyssi]